MGDIKANNTFDFIGDLYPMKDTEKFKAYEDKEYASGWINRTLSFSIRCGDSRHVLKVRGGCWKNGGGKIYTLKSGEKRGDKYDKIEVPWDKRFDKDIVDSVPAFKLFIADLGGSDMRNVLRGIIKKNSVSAEQETKYGVHSVEEAQKMLDNNMAKVKKYLSAYDYAEYLNKLVNSEACSKYRFRVTGDIEFYAKSDGSVGNNLNVTRVEILPKDTPTKSEGDLYLYFNKEAVVDDTQRSNKYFVNAKCFCYDSGVKANQPYDVALVIPNDGDARNVNFKNVLTFKSVDRNPWKEIGMKVNMIDGAQKEQITEDMLSENEREMIQLGIRTMDDIRRDRGAVYGDKIVEWRVCGYIKGYMVGASATDLTDDDFMRKVKPVDDKPKESSVSDIDIFVDDLDEI